MSSDYAILNILKDSKLIVPKQYLRSLNSIKNTFAFNTDLNENGISETECDHQNINSDTLFCNKVFSESMNKIMKHDNLKSGIMVEKAEIKQYEFFNDVSNLISQFKIKNNGSYFLIK